MGFWHKTEEERIASEIKSLNIVYSSVDSEKKKEADEIESELFLSLVKKISFHLHEIIQAIDAAEPFYKNPKIGMRKIGLRAVENNIINAVDVCKDIKNKLDDIVLYTRFVASLERLIAHLLTFLKSVINGEFHNLSKKEPNIETIKVDSLRVAKKVFVEYVLNVFEAEMSVVTKEIPAQLAIRSALK